jgi:predicted NBD/HSP70 family sugar kinase
VVPDGKPCYCGNRGCLERYLSLHSLAEDLGIPEVHDRGREVLERMLATNDKRLMSWCRQAGQHLRTAVCIVENMLDPFTILIGGSAPKPLVEHVARFAQPLLRSVRGGVTQPTARVVLSQRQEDSSILGAAVLPIHEMLSPRFEVLLKDRREARRIEGVLGHRTASGAGRL